MTKRIAAHRFRWTEQVRTSALLLTAFGYSDRKIGACLGCDRSTIGRRLGPRASRPKLSPSELIDVFERYDAQRNIEEVITAASGTIQQARLRTSLRARDRHAQPRTSTDTVPEKEALSDAQLRREVEALVGQRLDFGDADGSGAA